VEQVGGSSLVASDAISVAWGKEGSAIVAALIVICTFGAVNGNILSTTRVTYAMGKDRFFFPWAGREHRKYNTPANSLWLHGIWTSVFVITGSFNMLADMFIFVTWVAYLFGAIGIFVLRKKLPDAPRPYKTWGYPFTPILFILFSAFYLFMTVYSDISNYVNGKQPVINSLFGLVLTFIGVPLYFLFRRKNSSYRA
jgi:APA family basic amino acid/polyamine antiporter